MFNTYIQEIGMRTITLMQYVFMSLQKEESAELSSAFWTVIYSSAILILNRKKYDYQQ